MKAIDGLVLNWNFARTRGAWYLRTRRVFRAFRKTRPFPPYRMLKAVQPRASWAVYFVYLPDGQLTDNHRFTLERLRATRAGLFIVCASSTPDVVPAELVNQADAMIWKGLSGYDFSAYSLALRAVAEHSPGATTMILNDSVLGPFADLDPLIHDAPWDLTGFTASALHENHVQSYAFVLRNVDQARIRQLDAAFPIEFAFDEAGDVILCQELYFARLASHHMSVGSYVYAPAGVRDATLTRPLQLLDAGFPFLKKSLLGKHSEFRGNVPDAVRARLELEGHPVPVIS